MAPVTEALDTTVGKEGSSKRLECQVIGMPRPSVRWYKDGVNITTQTRYKFEYTADGFAVLILENVTSEDQGVYVCIAQNSEGSAETSAQLYIRGKMSANDDESSSVHQMTSMKKISQEVTMTSESSQRRPLVIGKSISIDDDDLPGKVKDIMSPEAESEHNKRLKDLYSKYDLLEAESMEEKGMLETESGKTVVEVSSKTERYGVELDLSHQDQLTKEMDELFESAMFKSSSRRLTSDSGITSQGSSFSSESDINIAESSMKEMKEYLHGKADSLFQKLESGKSAVTEIESSQSQTKFVSTESEQSFSSSSNGKVQTSRKQTSKTSVSKGKLDHDEQVNEADARKLAGMYLFDTGPQTKVQDSRHHVPELEIVYRKEALGKIESEETIMDISESAITQRDVEIVETRRDDTEFLTSEMSDDLHICDTSDIKILNEVNVENSDKREELIQASTHAQAESIVEKTFTEGQSTLEQQSSLQSQKRVVKTTEQSEIVEQRGETADTKVSISKSQAVSVEETSVQQSELSGKTTEIVSSADDKRTGKTGLDADTVEKQFKKSGLDKDKQYSLDKDESSGLDKDSLGEQKTSKEGESSDVKSKGDAESTTQVKVKTAEQSELFEQIEETVETKISSSKSQAVSVEETSVEQLEISGQKVTTEDEASSFKTKGDAESTTQAKAEDKDSDLKSKDTVKVTSTSEQLEEVAEEVIEINTQTKQESKINQQLEDLDKKKADVTADKDTTDGVAKQDTDGKSKTGSEKEIDGKKPVEPDGSIKTDEKMLQMDIKDGTKGEVQSVSETNMVDEVNIKQVEEKVSAEKVDKKFAKDKKVSKKITEEENVVSYSEEMEDIEVVSVRKVKTSEKEIIHQACVETVSENGTEQTVTSTDKYKKEWKLCAANEDSDQGPRFVDPLDERLVVIDDTQPVVPNIIIVIPNWKQNKVRIEDASLTDELRRRGLTTKFIDDDSFAVTNIGGVAEAGDIFVTAPAEVKMATSLLAPNGEPIVIAEAPDVVEKETGEKIPSSKAPEEPDIVEESVQPELASKNNKEVEIDKLDSLKPKVTVLLESTDVNVLVGESFQLIWKMEGASWSAASIYKNGVKVRADSNIKFEIIETKCVVTVKRASLGDTGVYSIGVTDGETDLGKVAVTVSEKQSKPQEPVTVLVENDNINVQEGETIEINWKIEGTSWTSASIYKENTKITAGNKVKIVIVEDICTLQVAQSTIEDQGKYGIKVTGEEKSVGIVKVSVTTDSKKSKEPTVPKIEVLTDTDVVKVKEGEILVLKWKIIGESWSSTSISKNGKTITSDENVSIKVDGDVCTLCVNKAAVSDSAVYGVQISNTEIVLGKVTVTVTTEESVKGEPSKPSIQVVTDQENVSVTEGESFELKWKITGESWSSTSITKNGKKITSDEKVIIKVTEDVCTLHVDKATVSDGAKYGVQISNTETILGNVTVSVTTKASEPEEKVKPQIEVVTDSDLVNTKEGETFQIKWKISGMSWSSVNLTKDGEDLKSSDRIKVKVKDDVCTLTIYKATLTDAAIYGVNIPDTGCILGQVSVSVADKRSFLKKKKHTITAFVSNVDVKEGEMIELKWNISGISVSAENIYKGDNAVVTDDNVHITIKDDVCILCVDKASVSDSSVYSIKQDNTQQGEITVAVSIDEQSKSEELEAAAYALMDTRNIDVKQGDSFNLKWKVTGADWSTASIYKDNDKLVISDDSKQLQVIDDICTLTVKSAVQSDTAIYSVLFDNSEQKQGEVFVDVITEERSKPSKEDQKPTAYVLLDNRNVQVVEGESFQLKWKITGTGWTSVDVLKDGENVVPDAKRRVSITDDVCTYTVDSATITDDADYTIRIDNSEESQGEVIVNVATSTGSKLKASAEAEVDTTRADKADDGLKISAEIDTSATQVEEKAGDQEPSISVETGVSKTEVDKKSEDESKLTVEVETDSSTSTAEKKVEQETVISANVDTSKTEQDQPDGLDIKAEVAVESKAVKTEEKEVEQETVISADVDTSKTKKDKPDELEIKAEVAVDSKTTKTEEKKVEQKTEISAEVDTSKTEKDKTDGLEVKAEVAVDSMTTKTEEKKVEEETVISADVDTSKTEKEKEQVLEPTIDLDVSSKQDIETDTEIDDTRYDVNEGDDVTLTWKMSGAEWANGCIYKDGTKYQETAVSENVNLQDDTCVLNISNATVEDGAVYSIRFGDSSVNYGAIKVTVAASKQISEDVVIEESMDKQEAKKNQAEVKLPKAPEEDKKKAKAEQETVISSEVDTSKTEQDQPDGLDIKAEVAVDSKTTKTEKKEVEQDTVVSADVDTSKTEKDQPDGLDIKAEVAVDSKTTKTEEKKIEQETVVCTDKDISITEKDKEQVLEPTIDLDVSSKQDVATDTTIGADDTRYNVNEGDGVTLTWKMSGVEWANGCIYKDGTKYQKTAMSENVNLQDDTCVLNISNATVEDGAVYSIRFGDSSVNYGAIKVTVAASKKSSEDVVIEESMDKQEAKKNQAEVKLPKVPEEDKKKAKVEQEIVISTEVDTSKTEQDQPDGLDIKAEFAVDSKTTKTEEKKVEQETVVSTDVDTSKTEKDQPDGLDIKAEVAVDSKTTKTEEKKVEQETVISVDVDTSKTEKDKEQVLEPTIDLDVSSKQDIETDTTIGAADTCYDVNEGDDVTLTWKMSGVEWANACIYKDGTKYQETAVSENINLQDDTCVLNISNAMVEDGAVYSIRFGDSSVNYGAIKVTVTASKKSREDAVIEESMDKQEAKKNQTEGKLPKTPEEDKKTAKVEEEKPSAKKVEAGEPVDKLTEEKKPVEKDEEQEAVSEEMGKVEVKKVKKEIVIEVKKEPVTDKAKQEVTEEVQKDEVKKVEQIIPEVKVENEEGLVTDESMALVKVEDKVATGKLESEGFLTEISGDDENIFVKVGEPFLLEWQIDGASTESINVYKDGCKLVQDENTQMEITDEMFTVLVSRASVLDSGIYAVRFKDNGADQGEITVDVASEYQMDVIEEPKFVVEPSVDVKFGRRLSLKCAVTGFPDPEVTWYHEGEALQTDALWDVYTHDGYHWLRPSNSMTLINCNEIVCRVDNDGGFVQRCVKVQREGNEVYCEPIFPPVCEEQLVELNKPPVIDLEISEVNTNNLRQLTMLKQYTDNLNAVTFREGSVVDLIACIGKQNILARNHPVHDKVCYLPKHCVTSNSDVNNAVCLELDTINISSVTQQQELDITEDINMPERRKMKSPSPKMTSTPKVKRRTETEETEKEIQQRLGFSESPNSRKEFSQPGDSAELSTEYNDGTTRPMFKKRLKSTTAKTGERAQLECQVSGNPLPKILWLKNNRPLKASDGCKVVVDEGTNTLVFPQARDEDAGIYTARAMNVNGSIMCSAEFSLSDGEGQAAAPSTDSPLDLDFTTPAYFFQMSSCEVSEGRLARFDCRVVAYPRPEIVWMRDGKVIDVDVRFKLLNFNNEIYSLLIQDVRIEDTGRYTCWARNKFGEAMTEAYLNVKVLSDEEDEGDIAPKFLTRFYDQQTTEGTQSGFKCLIAGRPEPSVTWLLDDIEIHDTPGIRMRHVDGTVSLEIRSPKVDHSGSYTCQLSNKAGQAVCSAKLTVIEDKLHGRMLPKFIKKFDHIAGKEGEDIKFSAVIVGEPRPDVMWLYDHKPISDTNRRFVAKEDGDAFTLLIKNLRFDDAGKITCKAVNSEGEVYCSANLTVRDSKFLRDQDLIGMKDETDAKFGYCPTFTKRLQDMSVTEGSKATFDCRVMGIPDPEISWMKDGRVITPGGRIRMTYENGYGQLVIDNVSSADTGVYTCIISNAQGKSSSTAALKLEDTTKKDKYKPEKLEDRLSRKDRYSPDKYLLDDIPAVKPKRTYMDESKGAKPKRPYVDMDKKYEVTPKRAYNKSLASLDDSFIAKIRYESPESPKRSYGNQTSPLETYKPYESPKLSYGNQTSPLETYKPYESPKLSYESPASIYEPYKPIIDSKPYIPKYESPLESPRTKYQSPVRQFDSGMIRYESPIRQYESAKPLYESPKRYESPIRQYEPARPLYESPKRYEREEPIKAIPKMPVDRPSLLSKREESVTLTWLPAQIYDLPEGARHVSYIVESRELPNQSWKKLASSVAGTTFTARNLVPDKDYEFRVRAQNQHGMSEPTWNAVLDKRVVDDKSRPIDIPEVRAPPRLPTHRPIITDLGEETVRLAWKPVEPLSAKRVPPVSYRLEAKELPGKDWVPMTDRLRDTSHYLSQLGTDRDYMIRVRAENDYGISEPTEPLWLPRARTFPGVPITRPKIVDYEETRAKLNWSRVDIPTFSLEDSPLLYMLEVEEPPFKDWRTIARDLDDTEYLVEGLRPGQDYRFRIRAKTATGVLSEPSPAVSLYTTLAQGRSPVDRLQMLDYEPDTRSLQLTWDRVHIPPYNMDEEPLMYMIEYNEPPMPDWKPLVTGIPTTRYRVMHLDPQRDYNFRVRALTSYGVSPPSPALPVSLRQPAAPRGLPEAVVISDVDSDSLRLTWKRPMYDLDRPISYKIEMLEPPFSNWRPIATNVLDTTYRVTGLKPTKDYQFRVIPQMGSSYLEPTPSAALTMLPVRPRLPMTEPKLKELTPESIQLSWRPAEVPAYQRKHQPIYYKVEMLELPSSSWVPVARKLTSPSYNMTGLRPDLEYKFRVFAETDGGFSEPSLPAVLHRRPVPKFSSNMPAIKDISQNVVHIAWKPADIYDGASPISYMVEMQTPPGIGTWRTLYANHPMPSVRLADLRPDLDYMVRVRVQCGSYLSEPTLPLYIPRRAAPPRMSQEQPYAVDIGSDYVKLQWRSAEIPSHIMDYAPITYRLEAQEYPDTTWITIQQGIPHTDFKVTGLNPQRDYSFRVRAENEFGLSDPTQPMNLPRRSVAPILPQDEPMLYDVTSGSCRLAWRPASLPSYTPHTSPITYTLFVQEYPFKVWRPLVKRIPHTSYFLTGLQPDKEYMFRIQAENDCGTSKPTSAVRLPKYSDIRRPVSMPEVSDFDEDLTSVKLRWQPRASPLTDRKPGKYTLETWEPVRRVWKPVARGVRDTTYQIRDLPKIPDHLFRVRVETEPDVLSEPSLPVSISKYSLPKMPVFKPQLYEVDKDTVRLSWQPVHVPEGTSRRLVKYIIEQRELPETHWFPVANDVTDTSYKIRGLRMKSDYEFRVKAVIDGTTTAPSYPVTLFRRPVIPKVKFEAPEVYDVDDTSLSLKWNTVDVPAFARDDEPLLFVIERQTLPGYEWTPVATNITDRTYKITDLKPYEDYNFRIRGVYPSGYTEPSPYVPVYRRPIRSSVPIARTEVWEEAPHTARLRWHRAYIPRYYSSTPIKYRVEMQEGYGGMTDSDWRPVARDVTRPDITVGDISPKKDYRFRIRAELENGDVSEPTPPIQYYRSHLPALREPLTDYKLVEYEAVFLNRPYFDHLTKYVPPRMPIEKPEMSIIDQESVELMWKPAIVAEAIKGMCNLSYTIEVRCPPSFEWRELVTGIRICSYTVTKLHPRIDYVFRIRAWNEYGTSETTLPVSLYRPQALKSEEDDDAEFEREWELKYGAQDADSNACMTKVPPKLPMDTPRIVTQTPESIWFSWLSARIPAYATQTNINYVVEVKEPPSTAWRREATSLVDCQYVLEGLNPNQEYHIRVRAETEFGPSEPTMPIIIRGKGSRPGSRRSSVDRDDINLEGKLDVSYLENLMSGVPPRMPSTRPIATNAEPDKLTLKWSSCRTPSYVRASNVTYVVEKRELPSHIWSVVAKDIKGTKYEVTGLNGDQDYMFRVRAKNEYGVSDPTLPMTIYRDRDDYVPPRIRSRSSSRDSLFGSRSAPRGRSTSVDYSGSRFEDIERSSVDRLPCEPELTTTTNFDVQYGMIGNKGKITLKVKAYPLPTVHWYFNDTKIEYGDLYNSFVTPTGDVVLEMKRVGPDSAGFYKCFAENASGSASKTVTFELAEPPTVLEPLQDVIVTDHEPVKFMCRVDGFPNATIKWTKDWRPIAGSTHCKISNPSSEVYQIEIPNCVDTDAGLYACTIENLAGKVVLTARLTVEIDTLPATFDNVNIRSTPIEDRYHVLEEIGRGRFGIVRRIIEMSTGRTFAANYMSFRNKSQKHFFMSEFQTLCSLSQTDGILKLYDAFETDRSLIFVTEYLSEPDLLEKVIKDGNWTESNVAVFIKKLLTLLLELEKLNILHLDIKPGNIRMTGSELTEPKLIGFGYSRTLVPEEEITQNYGSIGYASPEQITNDVVTQASDLWSVGVLAYLLLSGTSPFQSGSEVEVLSLTSECLWTFEGRGFDNFSKEAKDFIGRLLVRDPKQRMTLSECLEHPWLSTESNTKINTDRLKQFNNAEQIQRNLEKVYTTVQLQSFAKIIYGRKALYQPAVDIESGEIIFPDSDEFGNYLDEDAWYQWQLQYLDDPDSQIYPIQDEGFTVRECRHAGAPKFSKPKIKERSDRDDVDSGTGILFRDKIQPTTFKPGDEATFTCTVICEKKNVTPIITWYRDESLLSDDYRSEAEFNPDTGVAKLTIMNTKDYDSAVYKCVARIKDGRVSCQARLYLGDIPSKPGRPLVMQTSGTEVFLTWNCPDSDGNSYILGYRVDYRKNIIGMDTEYTTWNIGPYVTEEYALISGLSPDTSYIFRVCCSNKYGTSPFSWSSLECKTLGADAPKVSVAADLLPVMQFSTFDKQQTVLPPESRRPSLTVPEEATMSESDPNETFTFSDIISKGSYGEYRSCINKLTNQQCVAKIMPYNTDNEATVRAEFDLLHTLRQNNLITVLDSYIHGDKMYVIHEYLSGMNVIEYLCLHKTYSEEKVAFLVRQILDAVSFIQHYGIVHLNLQPSSIAMASTRRPHIKLRDFTLAQKIDRDVGMTGAPAGYPDFTCPEVLKEEKVSFTADIWTIGALTFTMLSGVSPFCGKTIEETLSRILFDRYSTKEMYDNVSKESIKFVCKLMSRLPRNRPTVNKCLDSQWMNLNESMVNSRSTKHFKSDRLRIFLKYYMGQRGNEDYKVAKVDIATLPKPDEEKIAKETSVNQYLDDALMFC